MAKKQAPNSKRMQSFLTRKESLPHHELIAKVMIESEKWPAIETPLNFGKIDQQMQEATADMDPRHAAALWGGCVGAFFLDRSCPDLDPMIRQSIEAAFIFAAVNMAYAGKTLDEMAMFHEAHSLYFSQAGKHGFNDKGERIGGEA